MSRDTKLYIGLGALVLSFAAALLLAPRPARADSRGCSSASAARNGCKAYYLLLESLGFPVRRYDRSFEALGDREGLLVVMKPRVAPTGKECEALRRWLARGNSLLLVTDEAEAYLKELGLRLGKTWIPATTCAVRRTSYTPEAMRVDAGRTFSPRVELLDDREWEALIEDGAGAFALVAAEGKGALAAVSLPSLFMNKWIDREDNALFAAGLARRLSGGRAVWFDEYHQKYSSAAAKEMGMLELLSPGSQFFLLQLFLALALLLHARGKRFGAPIPESADVERRSTEYVVSMASLYRRAGATRTALESLLENFLFDMKKILRTPSARDDEALAKLLHERTGASPEKLIHLLGECRRSIARERLGEKEVMEYVRKFDRYRKEIMDRV